MLNFKQQLLHAHHTFSELRYEFHNLDIYLRRDQDPSSFCTWYVWRHMLLQTFSSLSPRLPHSTGIAPLRRPGAPQLVNGRAAGLLATRGPTSCAVGQRQNDMRPRNALLCCPQDCTASTPMLLFTNCIELPAACMPK